MNFRKNKLYIIGILVILGIGSFFYFQQKDPIESKLSGHEYSISIADSTMYFLFEDNHKMKAGTSESDLSSDGNWSYDKKTKMLTASDADSDKTMKFSNIKQDGSDLSAELTVSDKSESDNLKNFSINTKLTYIK